MEVGVGAGAVFFRVRGPTVGVGPAGPPGPPPDSVSISAAVATANPERSFTAASGEGSIYLTATVSPADLGPSVLWTVQPVAGYFPTPPLPSGQLRGAAVDFNVTALGEGRWPAVHDDASLALQPKTLAYQAVASVSGPDGRSHESNRVKAIQDEIDVAREEYVELLHPRVPSRVEFVAQAHGEMPAQKHGRLQRGGVQRCLQRVSGRAAGGLAGPMVGEQPLPQPGPSEVPR
jgi:hypothetical protein